MKNLRNELWNKLTNEFNENNISIVDMWPSEIPDSEPIVLKLIDNKSQRILTIDLDVEREREFDFVIKKTGRYFEQRDLSLTYGDPISNIKEIVEIYTFWFIDNLSETEMDTYIEAKRKFYRPVGRSY